MGNQSAESGRPLKAEELASLAYHLFSEGEAVVDTKPNEAIVWFVQCLRTLNQVPGNEEFVVAALYFVGRALAQLSRNEESACVLRAAAYVGQQLEGETATDNLYATASLLSAIGAQALARQWFREAGKQYEALGLSDKAANSRQEAERAALGRVGQATERDTDAVEISFLLEGRVRDRVTVNRDGEMRWEEFPLDLPIPVGRVVPWQIACAGL
jgi:hypothetical protein